MHMRTLWGQRSLEVASAWCLCLLALWRAFWCEMVSCLGCALGRTHWVLTMQGGRRGDALKFCGVTLCVVTLSIYILYQEWTPRCQPNGCFAFGTGDVWPVHCWDTNSLITSPVHCHWSFRLAFAGGLSSERLVWIRVRIMLQIISFFIGNTW